MSLQGVAASALTPYHPQEDYHIALIFLSVLRASTHDAFSTTQAQQTAVTSYLTAETALRP